MSPTASAITNTLADLPGGPPPQAETPSLQDRRLVHACLASAPGAWDEFVGRFAGLLGHVVDRVAARHRVTLAPGDRDDLVAEVLVEVLRNDAAVLRGYAGRASLATYLTVVARRVVVRSLQRGRRPVAIGGAEEQADRHDHVAEVVDREAIEALLGTLDEVEARLVRLHHLEARSYGEISRLTGLPVGSIGPALSRARQKLRDQAG
ncbi:MAG: sigma-70 family RNA polymerase sigma factor [Planctomycetia bacterium]|nr:sigma-70 family RNA polymerase sigma factor [Planctomycetia bacterium]